MSDLDGVSVNEHTDFVGLAADALLGRVGSGRVGDASPLAWLLRAYAAVQGTRVGDRLARGVAAHLTAPEAVLRARALQFFVAFPGAPGAEAIPEIVAEDRPLFAGHANPDGGLDLESQLLRLLGHRAARGDVEAVAIAQREVLDPSGRVALLVGPLVDADPAWLFAHAEAIVALHHDAALGVLAGLDRTGFDAGDLPERVARLADSPQLRGQVARLIGEPLRSRVIAALGA